MRIPVIISTGSAAATMCFEYILSGAGYVELNAETVELTAGDGYILCPCTPPSLLFGAQEALAQGMVQCAGRSGSAFNGRLSAKG